MQAGTNNQHFLTDASHCPATILNINYQ